MIIAMTLYGIRVQRGHTQKQRVSVAMPVIDICRLAPLNIGQNSCITEPQQPQDVYLPCKSFVTCSPESLLPY
jgi:hypothetical protein